MRSVPSSESDQPATCGSSLPGASVVGRAPLVAAYLAYRERGPSTVSGKLALLVQAASVYQPRNEAPSRPGATSPRIVEFFAADWRVHSF